MLMVFESILKFSGKENSISPPKFHPAIESSNNKKADLTENLFTGKTNFHASYFCNGLFGLF